MRGTLSINDSFSSAMEDFAIATNLAVVVVDIQGNEVSSRFNFSSLCNKIRTHDYLYSNCKNCDRLGGLNSLKNQGIGFYRCHAGLVDFSVPLLVKGDLLGFIQCGQAKIEETDQLPLINNRIDSHLIDKELHELYKETETTKLSRLFSCANTLKSLSDSSLSNNFDLDKTRNPITVIENAELNKLENRLRIEEAINYICKNLSNKITLEMVSSHVNLSPYYFSRLFKLYTNLGLSKFVNKQRLNSAKIILQNKSLSISAVSKKCGFHGTSYFIRQFKLEHHVTPHEYRQSIMINSKHNTN